MVKAIPKVFYTYEGKKYNLKSLYSAIKKKCGKTKIKASVIVPIGEEEQATPIMSKIVFIKDRNKSRNWLALASFFVVQKLSLITNSSNTLTCHDNCKISKLVKLKQEIQIYDLVFIAYIK